MTRLHVRSPLKGAAPPTTLPGAGVEPASAGFVWVGGGLIPRRWWDTRKRCPDDRPAYPGSLLEPVDRRRGRAGDGADSDGVQPDGGGGGGHLGLRVRSARLTDRAGSDGDAGAHQLHGPVYPALPGRLSGGDAGTG